MASSTQPHEVSVDHRGSFAHATCATCGWQGAGRRAVGRARVDAEAHLLLGPSALAGSATAAETIDLRAPHDARAARDAHDARVPAHHDA